MLQASRPSTPRGWRRMSIVEGAIRVASYLSESQKIHPHIGIMCVRWLRLKIYLWERQFHLHPVHWAQQCNLRQRSTIMNGAGRKTWCIACVFSPSCVFIWRPVFWHSCVMCIRLIWPLDSQIMAVTEPLLDRTTSFYVIRITPHAHSLSPWHLLLLIRT